MWDDPGQHHDVKAAIVSAARGLLGEPVALRVLTEAAAGPGSLARQVLGTTPLEVEPRWRATYAELVLRVARSADAETRNEALLLAPGWVPWAPEGTALLAALAGDLSTTVSWRPALHALIACVASGTGIADLRSLTAGLAAAPVVAEAQTDRDLPAVQRLEVLAEVVRAAVGGEGNGAGGMVAAVARSAPGAAAPPAPRGDLRRRAGAYRRGVTGRAAQAHNT